MRQRIKKIFLLLKPKSTLFSVSLFLIIFGLLFLAIPKPAFGLFWGLVDVDLEAVPAQIFGLVLLALLKIGQGVVWAGTSILDFITEPGFISYSYTGLDNPIVKYGWTITRDLANIGIVLGLVIIALATILRIESYQAKKTLPLLIIVALLINFTPVIMGVIVDGSNILMGYFLGQRGKENPLGHSLAEPFTKAETAIGAAVNARADFPTFTVLTLLFFSIILFIILIIYSLLFLTRYLAIWILVVLSPLAFFCLIFPGTKSLFSQWWKQFINWCFIGVIAGFFLYLSSRIMTGVIRSSFPTTASQPVKSTIMDTILSQGIVVAFLVVGLIAGFATSAIGASAVVNFAKKGQKWTGGKILQKGIRPWAEPIAKRATGGITRAVERVGGLGVTIGGRKIKPLAPIRWFIPEAARHYAEFRPAIDEAAREADGFASHVSGRMFARGTVSGIEGFGHLLSFTKRGDSQDLFKAFRDELNVGSDEELLKNRRFIKTVGASLKIAHSGGYLNTIVRRDPRLAAVAASYGVASYKGLAPEVAIARATSEARNQHITDWEKEVLENSDVVEATMERGRDVWDNIARSVKGGIPTSLKSVDQLFSKYIDDVLERRESELAEAVRTGDKETTEGVWEEYYRPYYKEHHQNKEGYFVYASSDRGREMGYRGGRYRTPEDDEAPPTIPGLHEAAGIPSGEPPPLPPDTGEARKRKRKPPDTGKPE